MFMTSVLLLYQGDFGHAWAMLAVPLGAELTSPRKLIYWQPYGLRLVCRRIPPQKKQVKTYKDSIYV